MTYLQIPYGSLAALGADIATLADGVATGHEGARTCAGLDGTDHGRLVAAVDAYATAWTAALQVLVDNLTRTGEVAAIGQFVGDVDGQLADGLRPSPGPTP